MRKLGFIFLLLVLSHKLYGCEILELFLLLLLCVNRWHLAFNFNDPTLTIQIKGTIQHNIPWNGIKNKKRDSLVISNLHFFAVSRYMVGHVLN